MLRRRIPAAGAKKNPDAALILTVRNDARQLEKTCAALEKQTAHFRSIFLSVANSEDDTLAVAERWKQHLPGVTILSVGMTTRAEGRNQAAQQTREEILVFTDAGCYPEKNWLEELLKPFSEKGIDLVSGYTQVQNSSSFAEAQGAFVFVPLEKIKANPLPATRNMAIRRSIFVQEGGFLPHLNYAEDYEFSRRLQKKGYVSVFAPKARVNWQGQETLFGFFHMIRRLTVGDMVAGTWRLGHATMWLRYLVFGGILYLVTLMSGPVCALLATAFLFFSYLLFKVFRFHFRTPATSFWAILLQIVADIAVLAGTIQGLGIRVIRQIQGTKQTYDRS